MSTPSFLATVLGKRRVSQLQSDMLTSRGASARVLAQLLVVALLCLSVVSHAQQRVPTLTKPRPTARPSWVVGTLTLMASSESIAAVPKAAQIELPDIDVYLRKTTSRVPSSKAKTQLDGKFHLTAPSPGSYRVCWTSAGIGSGCSTTFNVLAGSVLLKVVPVRSRPGVIYGRVLTADNRPCWLNDPFFNLDVSTKLTLLDAKLQVVQSGVRANTRGGYAFGGVTAGRYNVRAECEKASGQEKVSLGGTPGQANITLPNHAPRVEGIAAFETGKGITRAAAGETINVSALLRDVDQDPIEYLWRNLDGSGSIPGTNSAQQNWTLGTDAGLQTLYLMARDGKGGVRVQTL